MAGSAANWYKPAAGPLKGQAVYVQRGGKTRAQVQSGLEAGTIRPGAPPAGVAKRSDDAARYAPGKRVAVDGQSMTIRKVSGDHAVAKAGDKYAVLGPNGLVRAYANEAAAIKGMNRALGQVGAAQKPAQAATAPAGPPRSFASAQDADAWGETAYGAHYAKLGAAVQEAAASYQDTAFLKVNPALRGGTTDSLSPANKRVIEGLDKAMAPVPEPLQVYRGIADSGFNTGFVSQVWDKLNVGDTYTDPGYSSTTVRSNILADSGYSSAPQGVRSLSLTIRVPKGASATYLNANPKRDSIFQSELELVLARGATFRVVSKDPNNPIVEVVP